MSLNLWCEERQQPNKTESELPSDPIGHRTVFEQDYDRILFSTPIRRLSDKTQVFPLDTNDGVRTRLTHSHEVSNIAKSIGLSILHSKPDAFGDADAMRTVLPLLGAIGLAHDLGNPPFGHQGEAAVCDWFTKNSEWIFDRKAKEGGEAIPPVTDEFRTEFLKFDGNPQTLRLLCHLQTSVGRAGLDLSAATIMAAIKYPFRAGKEGNGPLNKKHGFFLSEQPIVEWGRCQTGIAEGQRHPLTWIMEAADDIAYSMLDVEDAMKKGIFSPDDLYNILLIDDSVSKDGIFVKIKEGFKKSDDSRRIAPIVRDIKIGYIRSYLILDMVNHATNQFIGNLKSIFDLSHAEPLMDNSELCNCLKKMARDFAFGNSEVLFEEAKGRKAIEELLDDFWHAISDRKEYDDLRSKRRSAKGKFVYSLLSPNYLEEAFDPPCGTPDVAKTIRYRELRLLTDMISGMTDNFAIAMRDKIRSAC